MYVKISTLAQVFTQENYHYLLQTVTLNSRCCDPSQMYASRNLVGFFGPYSYAIQIFVGFFGLSENQTPFLVKVGFFGPHYYSQIFVGFFGLSETRLLLMMAFLAPRNYIKLLMYKPYKPVIWTNLFLVNRPKKPTMSKLLAYTATEIPLLTSIQHSKYLKM